MRPSPPLLLLLHFFLLSANAAAGGNGDLLRGDAMALLALKASLRCRAGALRSWSAGGAASVCAWEGVLCAGGRVVAVDVANMNLSAGAAPVSARVAGPGLGALETLSLAGNGIAGSVGAASLPALRHVNVSGNQLGGGLDGWDFATLPALEVFDAYDNNLSAPLPLGVAALPRLRYLDLGGNYFTGEIPAAYGGMPALQYLSLNGNSLQGRIPPELGNLTALRELYLGYYNVFDGGIPPELGRLRGLAVLEVSNCGLTGRVPPELGALASLDTLFLHTNQLTGPIPPELGNLTSLTALDLSNNALTGEVPRSLASLSSLKLLNLFLNRLHGPVPDFVAALPRLETLQLFMNNLTGRVPAGLGASAALRLVDLSSNRLTGVIPDTLCASGALHTAILMNNFLFGPVPAALGSCASLTRVRLGQNYLNGTIPAGLLYLPRLSLLELQNNLLSGPVPSNPTPSVSGSSQLAQLNLSNNLLSGPLPATLANLTALQTLLVSNNRLGGAVPPELGLLRRLVKLDLSGNALSGPIPAAVGRCGELTYLDLSRNNLSGAIPEAIAAVRVLNYLNLSRNALSGPIPEAVGAMSSLTAADFSYNDLAGRLPDTGQLGYLNATAFAGNPRLCGAAVGRVCSDDGGAASSTAAGTSSQRRRAGAGELKLVLALGLLACSVVFAAAAVLRARSFRGGADGSGSGGGAWRFTSFHKVDFGIAEVIECMKDGNVVGRGGAGVVYLGRTRSGGAIAVKRLQTPPSSSDDRGFRAEIRTLGRIRHRNIVRLLAFCTSRGGANVLVYEYMGGGSLGEVLHGSGGKRGAAALPWDRRYRIALEAARGLCYLHHDCAPMIVHRDVKSNNILLGGDGDCLEARVADFGLAKFLRGGAGAGPASECMSAVAGSYGYIAPEYAYTLRVDEKSDVYSYGVVLLELITGRRPVGDFGEGVDIVQWARRATGGRREAVPGILDRRLAGAGAGAAPADEVAHLFFVSMLCVQDNSVERPTMREVVQMLSEFPRQQARTSPSTSTSSAAPRMGGEESCSSSSPDDDGKSDPAAANCGYKLFPDLLA
ncbi:hypothetical protein BS78_05G121500 [Paspalum vaginatum]|nr:hypothetical protein BS78_05G121500 [Paspalum vaginatum]KAJ1275244.1 hypothetical protein BS78_05G121500 [Paspalum vaginatum]KAJ1275245.1 hypothetical protein BS78_05G121500 [Paspalum vaginatum]